MGCFDLAPKAKVHHSTSMLAMLKPNILPPPHPTPPHPNPTDPRTPTTLVEELTASPRSQAHSRYILVTVQCNWWYTRLPY